ncbi:hypothetical protein NCAS_0F03130 [Naumovozyma castellii]|uniref:Manganese/iron superoxide dismutase C-terminal domain-containing protein n=1 Tax=Naumovozyma castellii TaxID=27288 RepID=G0VH25_NAUCA|nr:hypothetical protein NCAS_0F03130 [Naumovozyma castellii CBS 4309]CCC70797.1 hypothetical protein NCAS_0F03130 [Naumovozyma castellii CBS 4309]
MLRRIPKLKLGQSIRSYIVPSLSHITEGNALPGLLSVNGTQNAWFDRTRHYTEQLNGLVKDQEPTQQESYLDLVLRYGESGTRKDIVNYASLLFNLNFCYSTLKGCSEPLPIPQIGADTLLKTPDVSVYGNEAKLSVTYPKLNDNIKNSFGSITEFKTLLINSNLGISGDGFTWLVARKNTSTSLGSSTSAWTTARDSTELFVVNTYNSGSPFLLNKMDMMDNLSRRLAEIRKAQEPEPAEEEVSNNDTSEYMKSVEEARQTNAYEKSKKYIPLLAIDASPKSWLSDYGVFGKQEYLERVWKSIDWNIVGTRLPN